MHSFFFFFLQAVLILICGLMTEMTLIKHKNKFPSWVYAVMIPITAIPVILFKINAHTVAGIFTTNIVMALILCAYTMFLFTDGTYKKLIIVLINTIAVMADCVILKLVKGVTHTGVTAENMVIILSAEIAMLFIIYGSFVIIWNIVFKIRKIVPYIWVYALFPISQIITIYFLNDGFNENRFFGDFLSCLGILLGYIADLILFFVLLHHGEKNEIKRKLEEAERVSELEKAHYEAMKQRKTELDEIKAGFERQLEEVYMMIQNGDSENARKLIGKLTTDIAATKEYDYCKNPVVNAVLTEKNTVCKEKDIDISINVSMEADTNIQPVHICSIYSNLLDNAINACMSYEGKKYINISDGVAGRYHNIKVVNSSDKPSKKEIRKGHGYGQKILKDIAAQYNGNFSTGWSDNEYTAVISLLMEE